MAGNDLGVRIAAALRDAEQFDGVAEAEQNISGLDADPRDRVVGAARKVALNAYGTKPRHTRARDGGCRDDCIPCGMAKLEAALAALDDAALLSKRQED